jgi:hypothetical protein
MKLTSATLKAIGHTLSRQTAASKSVAVTETEANVLALLKLADNQATPTQNKEKYLARAVADTCQSYWNMRSAGKPSDNPDLLLRIKCAYESTGGDTTHKAETWTNYSQKVDEVLRAAAYSGKG